MNTGFVREAETDDNGYYLVQLLPPGTYTVMASRAKFNTAVRSNPVLTVGEAERVSAPGGRGCEDCDRGEQRTASRGGRTDDSVLECPYGARCSQHSSRRS
ncbi:carboxypeptidase-like regulatory domain-containing protein [Bryocella elongata]|uniref:carboxypeptidase-like regulatory domain-containing protein n=1 Tax=Bryocella elongata TaxID=863522 RepID=UPI000CDEE407